MTSMPPTVAQDLVGELTSPVSSTMDGTMRDNGTGWAVGIFGDSTKSGSWWTGSKTGAVAIFGDSTLDIRQGLASGHEVTVRALAGFGDVRVNVPAGSRVETTGFGLFGC